MAPHAQLSSFARLLCALLLAHTVQISAVSLDVNSPTSIKNAAKQIAKDVMAQYTVNLNIAGSVPGLLPSYGTPDGYYWWVGGGLFGSMINYWHYTGDSTWNELTRQAIVFQSAPAEGGYFEPKNESLQLGNDDISFWAMAAMEAAEYKFPNPPSNSGALSYLGMTQAVFNRQAFRWDNTCGGGLRWQVAFTQSGYNYKNSISNGCFFQLGARLGKYTGNQTYLDWADKTFTWMLNKGLIDSNYNVYDGIITDGCSMDGHDEQWTYNVGVLIYGAACMWNATNGSNTWKTHLQGLLDATSTFLKKDPSGDGVITEVICEPYATCKTDQSTFKGYLIRWMRVTAKVAPWTASQVADILQYSAPAAAAVCTQPGTDGGVECGQEWYTGSFDDRVGFGMNMNAMEVIQTLLDAPGPITEDEGISKSDPAAGGGGSLTLAPGPGDSYIIDVGTGDKAGASILTILLAVSTLTGAWWIVK